MSHAALHQLCTVPRSRRCPELLRPSPLPVTRGQQHPSEGSSPPHLRVQQCSVSSYNVASAGLGTRGPWWPLELTGPTVGSVLWGKGQTSQWDRGTSRGLTEWGRDVGEGPGGGTGVSWGLTEGGQPSCGSGSAWAPDCRAARRTTTEKRPPSSAASAQDPAHVRRTRGAGPRWTSKWCPSCVGGSATKLQAAPENTARLDSC